MSDTKLLNITLEGYFKLSKTQTPTAEDEKTLMSEVLYASAVYSLMHAMVYTK